MKCECGHDENMHELIDGSLQCMVVLSSVPWTIFCKCVNFQPVERD